MKTFLYTLKVWGTTVISSLPAAIYSSIVVNGSGPAFGGLLFWTAVILLCTIPFALGFWLIARAQYKKHNPVWLKKLWLGIWGIPAIALFIINFVPVEALGLLQFFSLLLAFIICLFIYKFPSHKPISVTDSLKGRHILLRLQENNLLLHGIVLSELNIWPIKVQLHDKSAHPLLELHSMQQNELFTTLSYQTSVRVKAFTADRQEFLFTATLELDHTLN